MNEIKENKNEFTFETQEPGIVEVKYKNILIGEIIENENHKWKIKIKLKNTQNASHKEPDCLWRWKPIKERFNTQNEVHEWLNKWGDYYLRRIYFDKDTEVFKEIEATIRAEREVERKRLEKIEKMEDIDGIEIIKQHLYYKSPTEIAQKLKISTEEAKKLKENFNKRIENKIKQYEIKIDKNELIEIIFQEIQKICKNNRPYYWIYKQHPIGVNFYGKVSYDHSGEVEPLTRKALNEIRSKLGTGETPFDFSITEEFLHDIYINRSIATYESGHGLRWVSYNDLVEERLDKYKAGKLQELTEEYFKNNENDKILCEQFEAYSDILDDYFSEYFLDYEIEIEEILKDFYINADVDDYFFLVKEAMESSDTNE
jgi:hypothetical protein